MSNTHGLVDFHCHLDLFPDHEQAVQQADDAWVFTLTVTTTPKAWPRNHALAQRTRHVRAALGLHPQLVIERAGELSIWDAYLPETRYIGEVGLDAGPRFYKSFELQQEVFAHILRRCAQAGDKIITVHSIRAAKAVLDQVEAHLPQHLGKIVLHWFTGSNAEARRAIELGCYFSINAAMLDHPRHRSMIAELPVNRLLTETDGPFTKAAGRTSRPADVVLAVEALSALLATPVSSVAKTIRENLRHLLEPVQ